jgi:MFS family permease
MAYLAAYDGLRQERSHSSIDGSLWAPIHRPLFLGLFLAAFASNIGTWLQNVAAAWLMTSLAPNALMVGLVQTLSGLPVFLFIIPAGALADLIDRRRLLLFAQGWMLGTAALLGVLTVEGLVTPWSLLSLTFLLGIGAALTNPAWQASLPELVERKELSAAIALNSIQFNLARAIGPAIGGVLVAAIGAGYAFLINAASFLGVEAVLCAWHRTVAHSTLPAERLVGALKAGIRYTRYSPRLTAILVRTGLFTLGGSALPALLPLIARYELRIGATGYGELLGLFGLGGVVGGTLVPKIRRLLSRDNTLIASTMIYAAAMAALAQLPGVGPAFAVMFIGGAVWVLAMTSLNVAAQIAVPHWVTARALAMYQFMVQGGIALGGLMWGAGASRSSISMALNIAALFMVFSLAAALRYRLPESESFALEPAELMPTPVIGQINSDIGPVMVSIEYEINPAQAEEFRRAMQALRTIRFRDGAIFWGLFSDFAKPSRYVEYFMVESWFEHLRQHGRATDEDSPAFQRARQFHVGPTPPIVSHQIAAGGS